MCDECGCWEDEVEEETEVSPCTTCGGAGIFLGILGRTAHFRCMFCGIVFNRPIGG